MPVASQCTRPSVCFSLPLSCFYFSWFASSRCRLLSQATRPFRDTGLWEAYCLSLSAAVLPFFIVRFCRFPSILPLPRFHPKSTFVIRAFYSILPQFCRSRPVSTPLLPPFCRYSVVCLPHAHFCRCSAVLIGSFFHFSIALLPLRRVRRFSFFGMKSAPTRQTCADAPLGNNPGMPPTPDESDTIG